MELSENPYFQKWIAKNLARMNAEIAGKEALTFVETRIQRLSIAVAKKGDVAMALDSERVLTNLMGRLRKAHGQ